MLDTIAGWVEAIVNGIQTIIELVVSIGSMLVYYLKGLLNLFGLVFKLPELLTTLVQILPAEVSVAASSLFGLCLSLFILKLVKP